MSMGVNFSFVIPRLYFSQSLQHI
ncbi:unnamed protein product [Spirodela intermedia]|uniref:Uncharacterized protein n=1 Tax=Spirodela intermedia TaxID=51605 RepID=A0ABN7E9Y9_SPIIN|nr:unnamed protein product [Spirodela intermedia]